MIRLLFLILVLAIGASLGLYVLTGQAKWRQLAMRLVVGAVGAGILTVLYLVFMRLVGRLF